jgi:hypothetical protein
MRSIVWICAPHTLGSLVCNHVAYYVSLHSPTRLDTGASQNSAGSTDYGPKLNHQCQNSAGSTALMRTDSPAS